METPSYSHLTSEDYNHVYEPSEDSFLLLDALEDELLFLRNKKPLICLEIGPGSGIIVSALAKYLDYQSHGFFAVDINKYACDATLRTSKANSVNVQIINMDLLSSFKPNSIDLLVCNPPYVPTFTNNLDSVCDIPEQTKLYDEEAESVYNSSKSDKMLIKSWAGGLDGCEIINRIISNLDYILAPNGIFYLLIIKENNPERIMKTLKTMGYESHQIKDRKIRGEHLIVLKITKT
ncbi:CLUMA_CG017178, isoform A [Clunio marinus]|uniref:Methyltransferase HEMK2 n=1 Tax=Clunio marinus TaxID=568069 RepID=A0A1J1IZQ7_9DIPT|nr:CLUMA_CG017178, isoform A [Clunio marinus]